MTDAPEGSHDSQPRPWPTLGLLAIALVYVLTASRTVQGADCGEYATLAAVGGVAHPPGYPLFTMLLRALRWLPAESPAHLASLVSALVAVGAAGAWYVAGRAWGTSRAASASATALWAFAPLVWQLSTEPEVFVLNALLAAGLVWVSAPRCPLEGLQRVAVAASLMGLGACNHHTLVFVAPLAAWGMMAGARQTGRWAASLVVAAGALLAGLSPLAWLPWAWSQGEGLLWGGPASLDAMLHHLLRADYGTFQLAQHDDGAGGALLLSAWAATTARNLLYLPVALVMVGAVRGFKVSRPGMALLTLSWLLAGPGFALAGNINPVGLGARIVERFDVLPLGLAVVPLALGFDWVLAQRAWTRRTRSLLPMGCALAALVANGPQLLEAHRPHLELFLRNTLNALPPRAVVIAESDTAFNGYTYLVQGLRLRRDVAVVSINSLRFAWYRRQLARDGVASVGVLDSVQASGSPLIDALRAEHRPLFVAEPADAARRAGLAVPSGALWEELPPGAEAPPPTQLEQQLADSYAKFTFAEGMPTHDTWAADVYRRYAAPWDSLARAHAQSGHLAAAARCRQRAEAFTVP